MITRPESLEKLLALLRTLPAVGPKMSERIAFHILMSPEEHINALAQAILETYKNVKPCSVCGYWDDSSPCRICSDSSRDPGLICVVENPQDLIAMSRVHGFQGLYHVLGGALSPLDGVGPKDIRIEPLMERLSEGKIKEVVLALNPDIEGETTSQYIAKRISALVAEKQAQNDASFSVKVTRLAQGLPAGGELEYMDEMTLMKAFDGRKDV